MELDLIVPGRFAVEVQDEATHSRTSDYEPMTFRGVLGTKKGPRYSRKKEALCESQLGLPLVEIWEKDIRSGEFTSILNEYLDEFPSPLE